MSNINKDSTPPTTGVVIAFFGHSVAVETDNGQVFQCHLMRNQPLPLVGDKVIFKLEHNHKGVISKIQPRFSVLCRGEKNNKKQKPLAANIDTLLIVISPPPVFSEYLIDRYLIAAELLKITPIIVLNKSDLLNDSTTKTNILEKLNYYHKIGYLTFTISALYHEGMQDLSKHLTNMTAVLVGPSGVGKSSIIRCFIDEPDIAVIGDVSEKGCGKHTTTATRLYRTKYQGNLIDSPGVREFNLWDIDTKDILTGFKEFLSYQQTCKFRDCRHLQEPDCGIKKAVLEGKITQERFNNYQTLMKQVYKS